MTLGINCALSVVALDYPGADEERRFDTRFFQAAMPSGQYCRPDSRETVQRLWISPKEGLFGNLAASVLPVGEPFCRIWYDGDIWKPI